MVALGCVAQVVLGIPVENSCRNIQPDIVRGADWPFVPGFVGLSKAKLSVAFSCARIRIWQVAQSLRCLRASSRCFGLAVSTGSSPVVVWRSSSISSLFRCNFNCFSFLKRLRRDKPFGSALNLIVYSDLGLCHSFAQVLW